MNLDSKKNEVINSIINKFNFEDDVPEKVGAKTKEEKIAFFLEQFSQGVLGIAEQYRFLKSDELLILLQGLADKESKGVTYWDYIEVDTLLSLQKTKTNYPDEVIFIAYHQIHELYFKLIIQELEKITRPERFKEDILLTDELQWQDGIKRVVRYMNKLIGSLDILKYGLNNKEFSEFRKSLLPGSGFQTYQFRLIEIMLTSFENLIKSDVREKTSNLTLKENFKDIYWRSAVMAAGEPAKILKNFNTKYDELFTEKLNTFSKCNLYFRYLTASEEFREKVKNAMIKVEESILMWKIAHFKTVTVHLDPKQKGTGGLSWAEYLEVRNQKIYYFPILWKDLDTEEKIDEKIKQIEEKYPDKIMEELKQIWGDSQN